MDVNEESCFWCQWFILVVSSKSVSRKTCEGHLSRLRSWRGCPIDGKAISLFPDPCVLHSNMSLRKILNQKQPQKLHHWCEKKVKTFYLHSGQKTLYGYKSCRIQGFTLATNWLNWLLREWCAIYGYCFVDLAKSYHTWGNGSWMSPVVIIFHLPQSSLLICSPFTTFSSATTPAWSLSNWMRNSVHFEPRSFW